MVFQPVPDCALVIFDMGSLGVNWSNTFHFTKSGFNLTDMTNLAEQTFLAWSLSIDDILYSSFSSRGVTAYDLREEGGDVIVGDVTPVAGLVEADAYEPNSALVLTLRTHVRGRSGRGRLYLAGFTEAGIADGVWAEATIAAAITAVEAVQTAAQVLGWTYSVVSRYHNGAKRAEGWPIAITDIVCRSGIPGKQSRRNPRG
jgi:hypothetical protein